MRKGKKKVKEKKKKKRKERDGRVSSRENKTKITNAEGSERHLAIAARLFFSPKLIG